MTRGLVPPTPEGELSQLKRRVTDLERELSKVRREREDLGITWYRKSLVVEEWGPWMSKVARRIDGFAVLLEVAGSSETTLHLNMNGSSVGSVTLGAGQFGLAATLSRRVAPRQDILTAECTEMGAGAVGLTGIVWFAAPKP